MRALILDDEAAIGRIMRRIAEDAGFAADVVTGAPEFQARYGAAIPDLIMLDLQLGPHDGIEQLRFLGAQGYPNAVVLMSGFDERVMATAERLGRELGLDIKAALMKPVRVHRLKALLEDFKARRAVPTAEQILSALRAGELFLEYQPIVTCKDKSVCRLEALVRWNHPAVGRLAPDRFVPIAEQSAETIEALTDWVMTAAASDYGRFRDHGFPVPIAINVSGANLESLDFPDRMHGIVRGEGISPSQFCLEVTETAASGKPTQNMDVLARLRLKGFELAIDDFGTGYSSLKRLRQSPFSAIKIDRSFIADLLTSRDALAIVRSVADLARNMELSSIAEGVEHEASIKVLEELGVDELQGYFFARPMRPELVLDWLRERVSGRTAQKRAGVDASEVSDDAVATG